MPSKYCGELPRCKNSWWCAVDYKPTDTAHCFEPITNADRIRAMTDEELAEFLWKYAGIGVCPPKECAEEKCGAAKCWLCWLKQEVKE